MAPTADWSSPDLYVAGNWFTDSLVIADDGTLGSACNVIQPNLNGKFVIAKRTGCSLSEILANIQAAGAAGAVIVDSVSGRPLPFSGDVLSSSITIPFIVISEHIGDALIDDIFTGTDVVVSFGNKQNVHANDLGIYMERSWWSQYGSMDFESLNLPDSVWGTWVYNHGTNNATNVQVTFSMIPKNDSTQYVEVTSAPFDLISGDSVYVPLELYFRPIEGTFQQAGYVFYGYELSGFVDDDTLDNRLENYIWSEDEIVSHVYYKPHPKWPNMTAFDSDYHEDAYTFTMFESNYSFDAAEWVLWPAALKTVLIDNEIPNAYFEVRYYNGLDMYDSTMYSPTEFGYASAHGNQGFYKTNCVIIVGLPGSYEDRYKIAAQVYYEFNMPYYSTDMYHDMRRQSDSTFQIMDLNADLVWDPFDIRLTLLSYQTYFYALTDHNCASGLKENTESQVFIYPNPASEVVTFESEDEIEEISLIDLNGRIVSVEKNVSSLTSTVDVSELKRGMYSIVVKRKKDVVRKMLVVE